MPTEITILYADKLQSYVETSSSLSLFAWAELDGVQVAGDKNNPVAASIVQTGNLVNDLKTWIGAAMQVMTGIAPDVDPVYPNAYGGFTYYVSGLQIGNTAHNRPLVALGYRQAFTFGTLAIPARAGNQRLVWKFLIYSFASAAEVSPAFNIISDIRNANDVSLMVLELNAQ